MRNRKYNCSYCIHCPYGSPCTDCKEGSNFEQILYDTTEEENFRRWEEDYLYGDDRLGW